MESDFVSKKTLSTIIIIILIIGVISAFYLIKIETEKASRGTSVGDKAPSFTLTAVDGENFSLKDYKDKIVILSFFSVNCTACKEETLEHKQISSKYSEKELGMISIDIGDTDKDTLKNFKEKFGGDWKFSSSMETGFEKYKIGSIPTTYILNQQQKIIFKKVGKTSIEKLTNIIDNYL